MDMRLVNTILSGDTQSFIRELGFSPWGTQPVLNRDLLSNAIDASQSTTCSRNVMKGAIAIDRVTLGPGESWSFVAATWRGKYEICGLYTGGYLCNLASRYAQVADGLELSISFTDHGIGDLGAGPDYSVAIFYDDSNGDVIGEQDLVITNTTPFRVTFTTVGPPEALQVWGVLWS